MEEGEVRPNKQQGFHLLKLSLRKMYLFHQGQFNQFGPNQDEVS